MTLIAIGIPVLLLLSSANGLFAMMEMAGVSSRKSRLTRTDVLATVVGEIPDLADRGRHRPEARPRPDGAWLGEGADGLAKLTVEPNGRPEPMPSRRGTTLADVESNEPGRPLQQGDGFAREELPLAIIDLDGVTVAKVSMPTPSIPEAEPPSRPVLHAP